MKSSTQIGLGVLATTLVVGGFAFVARSAVPLQADDPAAPERSNGPHRRADGKPKARSVRVPRRATSSAATAPTPAPTTISSVQAAPNAGGIATTGTGLPVDTTAAGTLGCFCGVDTENRDVCFEDLLCADVTACGSSADCPAGHRCIADNCCAAPRDFGCFPVCPVESTCTSGSTCTTGYGACTNDRCEDAILLPIPGTATGDTTGATVDFAPFCDTEDIGPGVWYKVIGTGSTITASTCSEFNHNPDTRISVYCSGCSTLACAAGNDDDCLSFSPLLSTVNWCSRAGAEYLILVHDFSTASGSGAFMLNVWDDGVTCGHPPCPQGCNTTAAVDCGTTVNGDTSPYASTMDLYNCTGWDETGPEVVYPFTPSVNSQVTVSLSNLSSDLDVFILDRPCDATACIAYGNSAATFEATGGTTYYIVVDGFQGASGSFRLTATCTPVTPPGACCDDTTGVCNDGVEAAACPSPLRFASGVTCADLSPPCTATPTGACCVNGVCTGTKTDTACQSQFGTWFEGTDCTTFTCPAPPACPSNTLYGQAASPPDTSWTLGVSDSDWVDLSAVGVQRYESFPALTGPICDLHWWGLPYNGVTGACTENPMTFNIGFYDNAASTATPGSVVCAYTVSVTGTPTGWSYMSTNDMLEYHLDLPACCALSSGWVSIQGTGGPDCRFWWLSSPEGDGKACFRAGASLDCSGTSPDTQYDLSVCLTGATDPVGACCVDGTCVGIMTETSCQVRSGTWFVGLDCSTVTCPQPVCAPTTDGLNCVPVTCPATADVCLSTQVSSLAAWQVRDCACLPDTACHVVMNPDTLPAVSCAGSGCAPGQDCTLIATDTIGDGADDTFECRCEPLPCEQSGFPACGGICPTGLACVSDDVTAACVCRAAVPQACCLPDGFCADEATEVCQSRSGTPGGPGTTCGTFECPAVEVDVFPFSIGTVEVEDPLGFREVIAVQGSAEARVYFEGSVEGSASDGDGNGLEEVATEMTQLELVGTSTFLGPMTIRLHPTWRSMGAIEETTNNTPGTLDVPPFTPAGTASSFFDLFLQIDLPNLGIQLFTLDPKRMRATIAHKPPAPGTLYESANRIELFDAVGNPTGYFLGAGSHQPRPVCKLGDTNDDGGWNLDDFAGFLSCFYGPATGPLSDDCLRCFDYDTDGDVDVWDFGWFARIYNAQPPP